MSNHVRQPSPWFGNKTYNFLKFVAQILLPALGTLYFALAELWNLPKANEVVGTIVAVDTFLGVILGISAAQYNASDAKYDGLMQVEPFEDGRKTVHLTLHDGPENLIGKDSVAFKVETLSEVPVSTPGDLPSVPPTTP